MYVGGTRVRMHMYTCMYMVCVCVRVYVRVSSCVRLRVAVISDPFGEIQTRCRRSGPDSDSCCYGPDTLVIRRLIHEMIRRFVPIRTVKTRQRFSSKTASFHVSICSYVFTLFTVASMCHVSVRIISCDQMIYFNSMITRITS